MSRILIVDDEPNIRFEIAEALRMKGYDVREASDGNVALKVLNEQDVDVVITDILMPNREGLETIMEMRRNWPDVKIIAISGGGRVKNTDFLTLAKKFGAYAIMKKPFSIVHLRETVAKAIGDGSTDAK